MNWRRSLAPHARRLLACGIIAIDTVIVVCALAGFYTAFFRLLVWLHALALGALIGLWVAYLVISWQVIAADPANLPEDEG